MKAQSESEFSVLQACVLVCAFLRALVCVCVCVCVGEWLDNGCCIKRLLSPFTSLLLSLSPGDV